MARVAFLHTPALTAHLPQWAPVKKGERGRCTNGLGSCPGTRCVGEAALAAAAAPKPLVLEDIER
eukprot:9326754-Lingulodinium_polyedra.AAC.1